jgi:hypothetical protein
MSGTNPDSSIFRDRHGQDFNQDWVRGRFLDYGGQVHNVVAYGAVGDGVTDDTAAIQAAINAGRSAKGGTILFPPGVYIVNSGLTISTALGPLILAGMGGNAGDGKKQVTLSRTSGTTPLLTIAGTSSTYLERVHLRDLYLYGGDTGGIVVDMQYATHFSWDRVFLAHAAERLLRLRNCQDGYFNEMEFEWGGDEIANVAAVSLENDASATFNCNNLHFSACRWETNTYGHITITGRSGAYASQNYIENHCKFETNRAMTVPIGLTWCKAGLIQGQVIIDTGTVGAPSALVQLDNAVEIVLDLDLQPQIAVTDGVSLTNGSQAYALSVLDSAGSTYLTNIVELLDATSLLTIVGQISTGKGLTAAVPVKVSAAGNLKNVYTGNIQRVGADPSTTATTTVGAQIPMFIDTANAKLWLYYAGNWHYLLVDA